MVYWKIPEHARQPADDERTSVLWLIKGLGAGGAERLLVAFAKRADHGRFRFTAAYLLRHKTALARALEAAGVEVVRCLDAPAWDVRWLVRLLRLVHERRVQIVHVHSPLVGSFARPALRLAAPSVRIVTTEHNVWDDYAPLTRLANRATLGLSHEILAVSDEVRASMSRRLGARTHVVTNGIDRAELVDSAPDRATARQALNLTDDEVAVVMVANLRAAKDYPTMLRAARILLDRGCPVRFFSVGQGQLADEIRQQRDELGLQGRFELLGYRESPVDVLAAGDVFALSSSSEGLPIALLEAMAIGLPVVATSVGAIPSVVRDGVEGLIVPPRDPTSLAEAIQQLCDSDRRATFALAAQRRAADYEGSAAVLSQQAIYATVSNRSFGRRSQ